MSEPAPAVEAVDVCKFYDRGVVHALDGVSMTVQRGEFVAVTGPSGSGKSTLLHLLAALDAPTSGTISVNGTDLRAVKDLNRYRRLEIGLVFQLHNLLPHLSALANIEVAMLGTGLPRHERTARARRLLAAVGLPAGEHRAPPMLSGGERQRVAIARALANEPELLLADEPTGSLDSVAVQNLLSLFARLRDDQHLTIVMVTHDPAIAATADRVLHMTDGRILPDESDLRL